MPKAQIKKEEKDRPRIVIDKQEGSDSIWAHARSSAILQGKTISQWVWEAIRDKLAQEAKKQ